MKLYLEGMGIATGIAFDRTGNLYVGDRSGSIFKISPDKEIFVFATLEPSIAAYHLAFGLDDQPLCHGPHDIQLRLDLSDFAQRPGGEILYRTRPAAGTGLRYRRGALRRCLISRPARILPIRSEGGQPEPVVAGINLVGLAFDYDENLIVAEAGSLYLGASRHHRQTSSLTSMLSAEIIAIGSELLTPNFVDTNSMYLTRQLNEIGIPVVMKTIVGDDENYLEQALRGSLERTPILITIGGLGPTEDDVTKKVVARVLQRQLVLDDDILAAIEKRFKARGVEMPKNNARQALDSDRRRSSRKQERHRARTLDQCRSKPRRSVARTALRTACRCSKKPAFPASRNSREAWHWLAAFSGQPGFRSPHSTRASPRSIKSTRMFKRRCWPSPGQVDVRLAASAKTDSRSRTAVQELADEIEKELQEYIFANTEQSLEEIVGMHLVEKQATIAVAESCTGGMLAERLDCC